MGPRDEDDRQEEEGKAHMKMGMKMAPEPKENKESKGKPMSHCSTCGGAKCICSGLMESSKKK